MTGWYRRGPAVVVLMILCGRGFSAPPSCLKVLVRQDGFYAVTGAMLQEAGVALEAIVAERVAIWCGGKPVARYLTPGPDGGLDAASRIIFYGQGLDTRWTDTNVYWLTWDGKGVVDMMPWQVAAPSGPDLRAFPCTLHLEENHEYAYLIWAPEPGELDPWYWLRVVAGKAVTVRFDLPQFLPTEGDVRLRVLLRGRTSKAEVEPDHHVLVGVNGVPVAEARFDGQAECLVTGERPAASLRERGNELTVTVPGDTGAGDLDQVLLDWIEVEYPRSFACGTGGLTVTLPEGAGGTLRLTGVAGPVDLYDVTDPVRPRAALGLEATAGSVALAVPEGGPRKLVAVPAGAYLEPHGLVSAQDVGLRDTGNGADYIIIAYDEFVEAIRPLAEYRAAQGLRVVTVPVSAVYDEFSAGVVSPHALRDFLQHAYTHWERPAPRYVLLVGDASYDPRGYLGSGAPDLIPAYQARVCETIEMTTDQFYVDFSYGPEPLLIGRIPAVTVGQVATVVEKTISYENAPPDLRDQRLLLVGDLEKQEDGTLGGLADREFREAAAVLAERGIEVTMRVMENDPKVGREKMIERARERHTEALLRALSGEFGIVDFHGHGDRLFWGLGKALQMDDVARLSLTPVAPVVLNVTCFTGEFDCPVGPCLGEALLFAPRAGATAFVGPTRLGGYAFDVDAFRLRPGDVRLTLGEFVYCGKWALRMGEFRHPAVTHVLLGDPALRLRMRLRGNQPGDQG